MITLLSNIWSAICGEKDDSARGKILEAAKAEFLERGFAEASMRTIAERAGFTTGMLYSRFADKSEIFRELVEEPADELYNYFMTVQNEFAGYSPEYQRRKCTPMLRRKSTAWSISSTITSMPSSSFSARAGEQAMNTTSIK